MKDYLLFIDTEGSGLPKKWNLPYSAENNWPYSVQISWVVYTKGGQQVKLENHYIDEADFSIAPAAAQVHGITHEFLKTHGEPRQKVLELLLSDFEKFDPMVVGHFMELDAHMIGADFFRIGKENQLRNIPAFCTMRASAHLVRNPSLKYLRLFDLYSLLFKETLHNQHDASVDAMATADCFFEMLKRGDINEKKIEEQVTFYPKVLSTQVSPNKGCGLLLAIIFLSLILTAYWL